MKIRLCAPYHRRATRTTLPDAVSLFPFVCKVAICHKRKTRRIIAKLILKAYQLTDFLKV